jgi:hypothetical protein
MEKSRLRGDFKFNNPRTRLSLRCHFSTMFPIIISLLAPTTVIKVIIDSVQKNAAYRHKKTEKNI